MNGYRLTILMCCHNRKSKTLKSLKGIYAQQNIGNLILQVVLVDDGSIDGTDEAVKQYFPNVILIKGSGHLYWAGAMRLAFDKAPYSDYYLWLNDDTDLYPDAISNLFSMIKKDEKKVIVTGAIKDTSTQKVSYGGMRRISNNRLRFAVLEPIITSSECDATNGNCVLIPKAVYDKIGNIDKKFIHAHGDIDFGLRAKKNGFRILLCHHYVGESETKFLEERVYSGTVTCQGRFRAMFSIKALKPSEWFLMCIRHAPYNFLFSFLSPYLRVLLGRPIGFVQRPKI